RSVMHQNVGRSYDRDHRQINPSSLSTQCGATDQFDPAKVIAPMDAGQVRISGKDDMSKYDGISCHGSKHRLEFRLSSAHRIADPSNGNKSNQLLDVNEVINALAYGPTHLTLIVLCAAVALLDGYDTLAIAYAAPAIAEQWQLDGTLFGPIFAAHGVGGLV